MTVDEDVFTEIPPSPAVVLFMDGLLTVRRDLRIDPLLTAPWSCSPERCRPLLGRNLCCKVEVRCRHFTADRCGIHDLKPLSCALFPIDLVMVDGIRAVTTVLNLDFFETGWSRFDRDMLRCFEGTEKGGRSMFEVQAPVLSDLFTRSEMVLMKRSLDGFLDKGFEDPTRQLRSR